MKLHLLKLSAFIAVVLLTSSCGKSVQSKYDDICKQTQTDISELMDSLNYYDTYQALQKVHTINNNYYENINNLRDELTGTKRRDGLLDNYENMFRPHINKTLALDTIIVPFDSLPGYKELYECLNKKNEDIVNEIQGKYWALQDTAGKSNIFKIDNNKISFLNYKNVDSFEIENGVINTSWGILFFIPNDTLLIVKSDSGKSATYRKASEKDLVLGSWSSSFGYKYNVLLKPNGKVSYPNNDLYINNTYTVNGNNVNIRSEIKGQYFGSYYTGSSVTYVCQYNTVTDKLVQNSYIKDGQRSSQNDTYTRINNSGPYNLSVFFGE